MDFAAQISAAWADHGSHPTAVLERLPAMASAVRAPADVAALTRFLRHFVGEERGDWDHALVLCGDALKDAEPGPALALAEGDRAVVAFLAGRPVVALAAQSRAVQHEPAHGLAHLGRVQFHVATALIKGAHPDSSVDLALAALDLIDSLVEPTPVDRDLAIGTNNFASWLMDHKRQPGDDRLMVETAVASHRLWLRAGTWVNHERAAYLLALVHNRLGHAHDARACAERGLAIIAEHGAEEVDEAFLRLALSQAMRHLGNSAAAEAELARADALATGFDDSLKEWFAGERQRAVEG